MFKKNLTLIILFSVVPLLYGQSEFISSENIQKNNFKFNSKQLEYDLLKLRQLPELDLPDEYKNKSEASLPTSIDNSLLSYFRPIFNQYGWSCNQAASIGYLYTYEINVLNNASGNLISNQYAYRFIWNFLNSANWGKGASYFDGWEIIDKLGCPNMLDYSTSLGTPANNWDQTNWMSGYQYYYNSMKNRIIGLYTINVSNPTGLQTLKQWINDHLNGSQYGGVANFQIASTGWDIQPLPAESEETGKSIITSFGEYVGHSLTFTGYNDNIKYDLNNDGSFTNDQDINSDGIVDIRDWEIGAMIAVNSWGGGWENNGKAYVMYRLLAEPADNGGIWNNSVQVVTAKSDYQPLMTLKTRLSHNKRNKIKISAGVSSNITSTLPDHIIDFPVFNYQGGEYPMQGNALPEEIEIGLDITPLLSYIQASGNIKFFLIVDEDCPGGGCTGTIHEFSVINYNGSGTEFTSTQTNVPILPDSETILSVIGSANFNKVEISTTTLPAGDVDHTYSYQLNATGGLSPYDWKMKMNYEFSTGNESFPQSGGELLIGEKSHYAYIKKELDFSFPFYENNYNNVYVGVDGAIVFDENIFAWPYIIDNELVLKHHKAIAVFGADMNVYPSDGDGIYYEGSSNEALFRWNTTIDINNKKFDVNCVIRLFPDGTIELLYQEMNPGVYQINWIGGISNADMLNYQLTNISGSENIPTNYKAIFSASNNITGLSLSENGLLSGIPKAAGLNVDLEFIITDQNNISSTRVLEFITNQVPVNLNIPLTQGWNWISVNINKNIMSINEILSGLSLDALDYIKNQTISSTYYDGFGWFGELGEINPSEAYKLMLANPDQLNINGFPVIPEENPVNIFEGWNWIGFLPQEIIDVNTALESLDSENNDEIKTAPALGGSATYWNGTWYGLNDGMKPGIGYLLNSSKNDELIYPGGSVLKPFSSKHLDNKSVINSFNLWTNPTGKLYTMTVHAVVSLPEGGYLEAPGSKLAAFKDEECRGVFDIYEGPYGKQFQLSVGSDLESEQGLYYLIWNAENEKIYEISDSLHFIANSTLGKINEPEFLSASGILNINDHLNNLISPTIKTYPNPFSNTLNINITVSLQQKINIEIFNSIGDKVDNIESKTYQPGTHNIEWNSNKIENGIYFIRLKTKNSIITKKLLKI